MPRQLRVGIIGAGTIAVRAHLPAYRAIDGVEVVAVCDVNGDRARQVAQEFSVPHIFHDYESMLQTTDLDLVSVCVPNSFHASMTIAALEVGAHVLCEKPMALTVADGRAMIAAAEAAGRQLMVGFHRRFGSTSQTLKQLIDAGVLGHIYYAKASMLRRSGIPGFGSWFTRRQLAGGGALMDLAVHALDLALWFMGHPEPVTATGVTFSQFGPRRRGLGAWGADHFPEDGPFDVDDLATALIRFENGAALQLDASWAGYSPSTRELYLFGTEAGAFVDDRQIDAPLRLFADLVERPVEIHPEIRQMSRPAHELEIQHFVDCIRGRQSLLITPQQALMTVRVLEAISQSASSGQEVTVP